MVRHRSSLASNGEQGNEGMISTQTWRFLQDLHCHRVGDSSLEVWQEAEAHWGEIPPVVSADHFECIPPQCLSHFCRLLSSISTHDEANEFWNGFRQAHDDALNRTTSEEEYVGDMAQALTLILAEYLRQKGREVSIATDVYLRILQIPQAPSRGFTPHLPLLRHILSLTQPLTNVDRESRQRRPADPSDGEENVTSQSAVVLPPEVFREVVASLSSFLTRATSSVLSIPSYSDALHMIISRLGEIVHSVKETCLVQLILDAFEECLSNLAAERTDLLQKDSHSSMTLQNGREEENHNTQNEEEIHNTTEETATVESSVLLDGLPSMCMGINGPRGECLLIVTGSVLRSLLPTFVLSTSKVGPSLSSIPKDLLASHRVVVAKICDLVKNIKPLQNPQELRFQRNFSFLKKSSKKKTPRVKKERKKGGRRKLSSSQMIDEEDEELEVILSEEEEEEVKRREEEQEEEEGENQEQEEEKQKRGRKTKEKTLEGADNPILSFLCRAALLVPDRKEWRDVFSTSVRHILDAADEATADPHGNKMDFLQLRISFLQFLRRLLSSEKVSQRTVCVDLCGRLLPKGVETLFREKTDLPEASCAILSDLLTQLKERTMDMQPSVRIKILEMFASLLCEFMDTGNVEIANTLIFNRHSSISLEAHQIILDRAHDDRPLVRKAVLSLMDAVLRVCQMRILTLLNPLASSRTEGIECLEAAMWSQLEVDAQQMVEWNQIATEYFSLVPSELLDELSMDSSVLVRQKTLLTIDKLRVGFPFHERVRTLWGTAILGAVIDAEMSLVDKCLDLTATTVFNNIIYLANHIRKSRSRAENGSAVSLLCTDMTRVSFHGVPTYTGILGWIERFDDTSLEYLHRILLLWTKKHSAPPPRFASSLLFLVEQFSEDSSAPLAIWPTAIWSLLTTLASVAPKEVGYEVPLAAWSRLYQSRLVGGERSEELMGAPQLQRCVLTATNIVICLSHMKHLLPDNCTFASEIYQRVANFDVPSALMGPLVRTLKVLKKTTKKKEDTRWVQSLVSTIETKLESIILAPEGTNGPLPWKDKTLRRLLFLLGELAFPYCSAHEASPLLYTVKISDRVVHIVQAIATDTLGPAVQHHSLANTGETPGATDQVDKDDFTIPAILRAEAFVALGKFCVADESLAKKNLDVFVLHLQRDEDPSVRNNILVVLADLCVSFTGLVERYIPFISFCLSDSSALVRKQSLGLLAHLIAHDFVKFRGQMVYRFLYSLSDPHSSIRPFCEAVVAKILFPRQPNLIQQSFVELICFLNDCTTHPNFKMVGSAGGGRFSLLKFPKRRQGIYGYLFRHMTDRDRHEISKKLVHDFLAAFVDSKDEYSDRPSLQLPDEATSPSGSALRDALRILGCKQMKITFSPGVGDVDKEGAEDAGASDQNAAARRSYEFNLLKRNLAFQILPTLLSLKRVMEDNRSIFLRDLLTCLGCLLYDYRNELEEVLFNDPLLAKQLEFDFKRGIYSQENQPAADRRKGGARHSLLLEPSPARESSSIQRSALTRITPTLGGDLSAARGLFIGSSRRSLALGVSVPRPRTSKQVDALLLFGAKGSPPLVAPRSRRHSICDPAEAIDLTPAEGQANLHLVGAEGRERRHSVPSVFWQENGAEETNERFDSEEREEEKKPKRPSISLLDVVGPRRKENLPKIDEEEQSGENQPPPPPPPSEATRRGKVIPSPPVEEEKSSRRSGRKRKSPQQTTEVEPRRPSKRRRSKRNT